MVLKLKDGTKTEVFIIGDYMAFRMSKHSYKNPEDYESLKATFFGKPGISNYSRESLPEYCIELVGSFDKNRLEFLRSMRSN